MTLSRPGADVLLCAVLFVTLRRKVAPRPDIPGYDALDLLLRSRLLMLTALAATIAVMASQSGSASD
jgi:hypothetical protein